MPALPRPELRWVALAGLLLLAAALRLPGLRYGLPFPLLNPDEESIVPRAWEIGRGEGLDPGWYDYPSLLFYVLAPFEAFFSEPSYGVARAVAAALGIGGVGASWWLGRAAYGEAAGLVAGAACAVATVHVLYSHMAVTDVLVTAGVTVTLTLLVGGRLEWAGVAAGLAVSAKYPAVYLAVPLVVAGWRQWRRLTVAAALAVTAFVVTSPFLLLNAGEAWDDISRVQRLARAGWLGFEHDHPAPVAFVDRLWESLGPFLLIALAGLALALGNIVFQEHKPRFRAADLVLALVRRRVLRPAAAARRPLRPLRAAARARAGRACRAHQATRPAGARAPARPACLVGRRRARPAAHRHAGGRARLDRGERPAGRVPRGRSVDAACRGRGGAPARAPRPGPAERPARDLAALRARGVEYALVTGAVADRVLAAPADYPREARFYRDLGPPVRRSCASSPREGSPGPGLRSTASSRRTRARCRTSVAAPS